MRIALTRREYITHLDGVNRFIALLAEGLTKLSHDPLIRALPRWPLVKNRMELVVGWLQATS